MNELETELLSIMVKLMVRYPDGLERIASAFLSVIEVEDEMNGDSSVIH